MSKKKKAKVEEQLHTPVYLHASKPLDYYQLFLRGIVDWGTSSSAPREKQDLLAGLDELLVGIEDMESGVVELPTPPVDMTSYHDAFAAAAKACAHHNYEDTMYAKREARCNDCGRYFTRSKNLFGW